MRGAQFRADGSFVSKTGARDRCSSGGRVISQSSVFLDASFSPRARVCVRAHFSLCSRLSPDSGRKGSATEANAKEHVSSPSPFDRDRNAGRHRERLPFYKQLFFLSTNLDICKSCRNHSKNRTKKTRLKGSINDRRAKCLNEALTNQTFSLLFTVHLFSLKAMPLRKRS